MTDAIQLHPVQASQNEPLYSILIPTWNNLEYLKCCVGSIEKNSAHDHQVVVHVNEGTDGSKQWAADHGIDHSLSESNVGICVALNSAFRLAKANYIVYMNDDMYACPNWDAQLLEVIEHIGHDDFFLSATMIEHTATGNPCVIAPVDYGQDISAFNEAALLHSFDSHRFADWSGATWPPNLVHRKWWQHVGGLSESFSPGFYSDPDFSMKLWQAGIREFRGVGASRVYHFQSKTLHKAKLNKGRKTFYRTWHLPPSWFLKRALRIGQPYVGRLREPKRDRHFYAAKAKAFWHRVFNS